MERKTELERRGGENGRCGGRGLRKGRRWKDIEGK